MKLALKILLPILVISGGLFGAGWLILNKKPAEQQEKERFKPRVQCVAVELEDYRPVVRSQGTVRPRMEIGLSAEVSGRVQAMSPAMVEGGLFKDGEELLRIDATDYELSLRQARARIDTARAGITNAFAQMSGARSQIAQAEARISLEEAEASAAVAEWQLLGRKGKPPALLAREPQLKEALAALDSAKALLAAAVAKRQSDEADLVAAKAAEEQALANVERCVVKAPFDGRVASRLVGVGQVVSPVGILARLQAIDVAEVRLALPLNEFESLDLADAFRGGSDVENGPKVQLRSSHSDDVEWAGRVVRSTGEVDSGTRMMPVVAQVADPYQRANGAAGPVLTFGMFVKAEIDGFLLRGVSVLPRVVLRENSTVHVLKEGKLFARKVRVAWSTREVVVVDEGLEEGDLVCLTAVDAFVEGMGVLVMEGGGE